MIRERVVKELLATIQQLGSASIGSEWYIFGSVERNEPNSSDIDLLILCIDDAQADELRRVIDPDSFALPLDLCLMTYDEAAEIDVIQYQSGRRIFPSSKT